MSTVLDLKDKWKPVTVIRISILIVLLVLIYLKLGWEVTLLLAFLCTIVEFITLRYRQVISLIEKHFPTEEKDNEH